MHGILRLPFLGAAIGPLSWLEFWLIIAVILLLLMIWVLTHHQESHFRGQPEGDIDELLQPLAGSTHGHVTSGNSVRLVLDENYFTELCREISEARKSVHFETFLWKSGQAADMIASALAAAARRGVKTRVLIDARGGSGMSAATKQQLKEAGCELGQYHPFTPMNFGRFNLRDHRKIAVLDGRTAYVGGHCVTDDWLKDRKDKPRTRDITARLGGPVVNAVQSVFLENWEVATGELFTNAHTFPDLEPDGDARAHVASVRPDGSPSAVQILHYLVIGMAKKSILIQNPYFLPDPRGADALVAAAQRGVDVRIMTPSPLATDNPFISAAGHFLFHKLLKGGVRIFEYEKCLLHQKTIVVDGKWCGIGSSNFDDRSFEINDEITVGIVDRETIAQLESIFEKDMRDCSEPTLGEWKKRSVFKRCLDGICYLFNEQF